MRFLILFSILFVMALGFFAPQTYAAEVLGIHILSTGELSDATTLLKVDSKKDQWNYITVPFTLGDLEKKDEWERFFVQAKEYHIQPIVRLATRFQEGSWQIPTRKNIIDMVAFLSALSWPQEERIVVVFNEPNHDGEWGGRVDPEQYAHLLQFTADWLRTEDKSYVVLPAGVDLAAPNGPKTMEAFTFLRSAFAAEPNLLESLDGWTSHSYPNPAFSAAPTTKGKMGLRGFSYELAFLREYTTKDLPVYITETGWIETPATSRWLSQYYQYAARNIWSDPRVRAVTPFVLRGDPGSFSQFSFLDKNGKPTAQFWALRKVLE